MLEVEVLELRRRHPGWGPRRIGFELGKKGLTVSESGVYRALLRAGLVDPGRRSVVTSIGGGGSGLAPMREA